MKFSENRPLAWAVLFVCVLVSIVLFGGLGLREDRQSVEEVFYTGADDAYFSLNGYIDRRAAAAQKLADRIPYPAATLEISFTSFSPNAL